MSNHQMPRRLAEILQRNADEVPNSTCWIERCGDQTLEITWRELWLATLSLVDFLLDRDVKTDERVVLWGPNSLEWVLTALACSYTNSTLVPLDSRLTYGQAESLCRFVEPRFVLCSGQLNPLPGSQQVPSFQILKRARAWGGKLAQTIPACDANDISNILFTSGTSSQPKGVMLSHGNLVANALGKLDAMPQFPSDHRLNLLPFSHAYALTCELVTWLISQSSLEIASSYENLLELLPLSNASLVNAVPAVYRRLFDRWRAHDWDCDVLASWFGLRLRQLASGGAPLPDEIRSRFAGARYPIHQGYGLTEAGPVVCSNRSKQSQSTGEVLVGVGPPIKGVEIKMDGDSQLWVRSPGVMRGYWKDPQATDERIVDGWLCTGDIARRAADNISFEILGRNDDTIVLSNGYKIYPMEWESRVLELEFVDDCVLLPDSQGHCQLIVLPNQKAIGSAEDWQTLLIRQIMLDFRGPPPRIVVERETWSEANGCRNFKGAKKRNAIKQRYCN